MQRRDLAGHKAEFMISSSSCRAFSVLSFCLVIVASQTLIRVAFEVPIKGLRSFYGAGCGSRSNHD